MTGYDAVCFFSSKSVPTLLNPILRLLRLYFVLSCVAALLFLAAPEPAFAQQVEPGVTVNDDTVREDAGTATLTITLSEPSAETVTVEYEYLDMTAVAGEDYQEFSGTLVFTPGQTEKTVTVTIIDDNLEEENEYFCIRLTSADNARIVRSIGEVYILDNDGPPALFFADFELTVWEDAGSLAVDVALTKASADQTIKVSYLTGTSISSTATGGGQDYTDVLGDLTFPPGDTRKTFSIPITNDSEVEEDETFLILLFDAENADYLENAAVATILDDDEDGGGGNNPEPEISVNDVTVDEGDGAAEFTISLSESSNNTVTVDYRTMNGSAMAGNDYTGVDSSLSFSPGQTEKDVPISIIDDTETESNESFSVLLENPQNATLSDDTGIATINDNDSTSPPPQFPELSINNVSVNEGAGSATFTVSMDSQSSDTVTVDYRTVNGTATAGSDYTSVDSSLSFSSGQTSMQVSVTIINDTTDESNETFLVVLDNPQNATIDDDTGVATIIDNDNGGGGVRNPDPPLPPPPPPPPPAKLSINSAQVDENAESVTLTVTMDRRNSDTVRVDYQSSDGTATAGDDYTGVDGTLTFRSGETEKSITAPILDDLMDEPEENFSVTLSNPAGAEIEEGAGVANVTIQDDDATPELSINDVQVDESAGVAVMTVSMDMRSSSTVSVDYQSSDGTATAGEDYTGVSTTLEFMTGEITKTIAVVILDDSTDEPDENFSINLSNPSGAEIDDGAGMVTIADNDEPPPPVIGAALELVSTNLVDEDTLQASFRIYLQNYGEGDGLNTQVMQDFPGNFASPLVVSVVDSPTISGDLSMLNTDFDGDMDTGLLAGTETLAPGESATVSLTIQISLNGIDGPFANRVLATALGEDGNTAMDLSDSGTNPDPDGDGNPAEPGENDYTIIEFSSAIIGTVFSDNDIDKERDESEAGLRGWTVELVDEDDMVVDTQTTSDQGGYFFSPVDAGSYEIRFKHSETNVVWSEIAVEVDSSTVTRLDLPVATGGRVYDSTSRELVSGVRLQMTNWQGWPIAEQCLLPGQQNQVSGSDGAYRFDLQPGAHADCSNMAMQYNIEVVETPEGYIAAPSILLAPEDESLNVESCAASAGPDASCVVQQQHLPPGDADDTTYYLSWILGAGYAAAFHNHIPIDPAESPAYANLIAVSKESLTNFVAVGEPVGYEIRLTNTTSRTLRGIELRDNLPNEFNFIADSATIQDVGATQDNPGRGGSSFVNSADADEVFTSGTDPVTFGPFDLAANSTSIIRYVTRASTRVRQGSYTNTATPVIGARIVGNSASAVVNVASDPVFQQTTVIGQVFADHDEDGEQDPDEPGIPGVRLATVEGLLIETDQHGRYHVAAVEVENAARGANFIIKLDPQTLPAGAEIVSENPRVLRITQSLMSRIDFAVKLDDSRELLEEVPARAVVERTVIRFSSQRIEPVRFESGFADIPENYAEQLQNLLDEYGNRQNLRVRFVGHTDDVPLSERITPIYGDNQGLSEARAAEVARFVTEQLNLDLDTVEIEGRSFRQPIATNLTEEGRALNRRVEIELVFDEEITETSAEFEQADLSELLTEPQEEVTYETVTDSIEPVRFAAADTIVTEDQISVLQENLESFSDFEIQSVRLVGYSDLGLNSADGAAGAALGQANQRAINVAQVLMELLDLSADQINLEARTTTERIAANTTAFGQSLNRRVEVEITYRRIAEIISTRNVVVQPAQMAPTTIVEGAGRIWLTEDAFTRQAQLSVLALQPVVVDQDGSMTGPVQFAAHGNYGNMAQSYRLDVYRATDVDLARPITSVTATELVWPQSFSLYDQELELEPGEQLVYVLRAMDASGNEDFTTAQLVNVAPDGQGPAATAAPEAVLGQSILDGRQIILSGSRVRVHGAQFESGEVLQVGGMDVQADVNGSFVSELFLPPGSAEIEVEGGAPGNRWVEILRPEVDDEYTFIIGLANLTIGQDSFSGSYEALSDADQFDESVYLDGRLAFYAKAKIRGKYLITAQMDSTEDDLENLGDNLRRRDPRRMFRQLDPDRYYPIYGDDSTTVSDVDTQGALYVRIDWDRNQLLWGNYNTGLTDTEYLAYNRSLYGARTQFESDGNTVHGDPRYSVTAFASESESAAAHVTFRATGGSIYYLKHTDVVQGSEKVWMEVRQRDTRQVIERREYVEGLDYEIDALQGRIILRQPLQPVTNDYNTAIIRSRGIDGDEVYLLTDYEYVPTGFSDESMTVGARGKVWLSDNVGIGATSITDDSSGEEYELQGVDVTFKASPGTYVNLELAQSEASQNGAGFESFDGGLRFNSMDYGSASELNEGEAVAIEARLDIADISEMFTGNVRAWWKDRDPGFSSGNIMQNQIEREAGVDFLIRNDDGVLVQANLSEVRTANNDESVVARVQADVTRGKVTVGGEIRYEDLSRNFGSRNVPSNVEGEALMVGARVGYELNENQTLYGKVQTGLDEEGEYVENDRIAAGLRTEINDNLALTVEASDGDRGSALSGGVEFAATENFTFDLMSGVGAGALSEFGGNYQLENGHELYASYMSDPDRTFGDGDMMTLGQRRDFGNRFGVYTESHFGENDRYAGANHSFGLDYATESDWILSGVVSVANDELLADPLEREAISFGASVDRDDYKFSARTEYRTDDGPNSQVEQYLLTSSYSYIMSESSRWVGRLNLLRTDDALSGGEHARFTEFDIGHAYRPAASERWTSLTRYSYLYDAAGAYQYGSGPDQRVHILSAEALYQLNPLWEVGAKLAWKSGEARAIPSQGNWYDYEVSLAVARARYSVMNEWDVLAEYRVLEDRSAGNTRHGILIGVYRSLSENFQVGGGYNFTDFSDDLRDAEYNKRGFFIDIVGSL